MTVTSTLIGPQSRRTAPASRRTDIHEALNGTGLVLLEDKRARLMNRLQELQARVDALGVHRFINP